MWKGRLRDKFINGRRRIDKEDPDVKLRKLKRPADSASESGPPTKSSKTGTCMAYGVPNYLPNNPKGEDEISIERHIEWMKKEKKTRPRKPDHKQIQLLMNRTFAYRRNRIVNEAARVTNILEEFPWLADEDEVTMVKIIPLKF